MERLNRHLEEAQAMCSSGKSLLAPRLIPLLQATVLFILEMEMAMVYTPFLLLELFGGVTKRGILTGFILLVQL